MKISIITVSYNAAGTIRDTIDSVLRQSYDQVEYIIVDGASSDGTRDIVESYRDQLSGYISEPDNGLYDAMNKGLNMATGDIIGILNADDFYEHDQVLSNVVAKMEDDQADALFADLVYVNDEDLEKVVRYYPGKGFTPQKMLSGNMPPHPTFFLRKRFYDEYGDFDTSYEICADFDLMVRFFHKARGKYTYLPETIVRMRTGGNSTNGIQSTLTINKEMLKACRKYGLKTNLAKIYSKYPKKLFQLFVKPSAT